LVGLGSDEGGGLRVDFTRIRFLVVDDNTYMRRIIRALLHGFGAREVVEAEDGAIGIESFIAQQPDVVILDWEMPILDGIEVTRMIRQPGTGGNPNTPIIMVSGHTEKRRIAEARDAGVTEFLAKPVSSKALYDRVFSVVAHPRPFIKTALFYGPDRRRSNAAGFIGNDRRKANPDLIKQRSIIDRKTMR
jgi:two-component system, chemotaxis family, chemotaxis protein CheY